MDNVNIVSYGESTSEVASTSNIVRTLKKEVNYFYTHMFPRKCLQLVNQIWMIVY